MKRVLVSFAGSRIGLGVSRSLKGASEPIYVIGVDANEFHLQRAVTDERYLIPRADDADFLPVLCDIIAETRPDLVWVQHEGEIAVVAQAVDRLGAKTFLPSPKTIALCQDKMRSYEVWRDAGLPVPASMRLDTEEDLRAALMRLGHALWLRALEGAGGKGALPVDDFDTGKRWIDLHEGWGRFMAAERMTERTVTSESIWREGELLVLQAKERFYWEFANLTLSKVTGIPGAQKFVDDPLVDETAIRAIKAVDSKPHGVFGVDMAYDSGGVPRVTEINAGRFMSAGAIHIQANGFNFPHVLVQIALGETPTGPLPLRNPLPTNIAVIHGMDTAPVIAPLDELDRYKEGLGSRRRKVHQEPAATGREKPAKTHSGDGALQAIV